MERTRSVEPDLAGEASHPSEKRPVPVLAIIVPCFNEETALGHTVAVLTGEIDAMVADGAIRGESYLLFVDDGSSDNTWSMIRQASTAAPGRVRGLKLSRNVGHQNALLAGLLSQIGKADAMISIDADLQDDVACIEQMVRKYNEEDAEIVYGLRRSRDTDSWFKRNTANTYYSLMRWLGADIIPHHADFRLMSDQAIRALSAFREVNLFLRGLVPKLGFKCAVVEFDRLPRLQGTTKYTLKKMVLLALDGITSLSVRPIRMVALLGVLMFVFFLVLAVWVFIAWLAGETIQGWTSAMLVFLLIAAFQTCALAVIGEYVGKIYFETKSRPRYFIESETER